MTIKTLGIALAIVFLMSGPAGATETQEPTILQDADAVEATSTVEAIGAMETTDSVEATDAAKSANTIQDIDSAPVTDPLQSTERVQVAGGDIHDPGAVRCKRIARTGTRFTTKVCATNRQWQAAQEAAQEQTEAFQQGSGPGYQNQAK